MQPLQHPSFLGEQGRHGFVRTDLDVGHHTVCVRDLRSQFPVRPVRSSGKTDCSLRAVQGLTDAIAKLVEFLSHPRIVRRGKEAPAPPVWTASDDFSYHPSDQRIRMV